MPHRRRNKRTIAHYVKKNLMSAMHAVQLHFPQQYGDLGINAMINSLITAGIDYVHLRAEVQRHEALILRGEARVMRFNELTDELQDIRLFFEDYPEIAEDFEIFRLKVKRATERNTENNPMQAPRPAPADSGGERRDASDGAAQAKEV